jgi:hypothetical protein
VFNVLRTPNEVKWIATAAIVALSRDAGDKLVGVLFVRREGGSSSKVGMQTNS